MSTAPPPTLKSLHATVAKLLPVPNRQDDVKVVKKLRVGLLVGVNFKTVNEHSLLLVVTTVCA